MEKRESNKITKYYPMHPCSDEEFKKFFAQPDELDAREIEKI